MSKGKKIFEAATGLKSDLEGDRKKLVYDIGHNFANVLNADLKANGDELVGLLVSTMIAGEDGEMAGVSLIVLDDKIDLRSKITTVTGLMSGSAKAGEISIDQAARQWQEGENDG